MPEGDAVGAEPLARRPSRAGTPPRSACPSSARSARGTRRSSCPGRASAASASPRRAPGRARRRRASRPRGDRRSRRAPRTRTRRGSRRRPCAASAPKTDQAAGSPRRSRAPSTRSSCTSVAMCTSSTATPAATRRLARSAGEEAEQRPQPLAAGRQRLAGHSPRKPGPRGDGAREPGLDLRHVGRDARGRMRPARAAGSCSGSVAGVQRDDRAGEQAEAHVAEAALAEQSRELPRQPGTASPTRAGTCTPSRRAAPCRAAARRGRTRARRTAAATPRGCVISRIASRPPGRSTRRSSRSAELEVGDVAHAEADRRRVERRRRRTAARACRPAPTRAPCALRRARASIASEKSSPVTWPAPACRSAIARSPVPQAASSTRSPGRTADSAASRRQRMSRPAVMTRFITS